MPENNKNVTRTNIENAFSYLLNAIDQENISKSREMSLVITNIGQAMLWFTKVVL